LSCAKLDIGPLLSFRDCGFAPEGASCQQPKASKPGPRMNALEKIDRDNQIVVARMRGIS
jgi:hypothetical protein